MAIDSYGTVSGVAALTPRYASGRGDAVTFTGETRPTEQQVLRWLSQISAFLTLALRSHGVVLPLQTEEVRSLLDSWAESACAALVEGVNGVGRFGAQAEGAGIGTGISKLQKEAVDFIDSLILGGNLLGETVDYSQTSRIGYKRTEETGERVFPLIQRQQFNGEGEGTGAQPFIDWEGYGRE